VRAFTAEQTLIPVAAHFDIAHANQRLCTHRGLRLVTVSICPSAPPASRTIRPCASIFSNERPLIRSDRSS
jgi:hypothetical protein